MKDNKLELELLNELKNGIESSKRKIMENDLFYEMESYNLLFEDKKDLNFFKISIIDSEDNILKSQVATASFINFIAIEKELMSMFNEDIKILMSNEEKMLFKENNLISNEEYNSLTFPSGSARFCKESNPDVFKVKINRLMYGRNKLSQFSDLNILISKFKNPYLKAKKEEEIIEEIKIKCEKDLSRFIDKACELYSVKREMADIILEDKMNTILKDYGSVYNLYNKTFKNYKIIEMIKAIKDYSINFKNECSLTN